MKISVNFVYFQSCNRTHVEEGDNSLRERYREKSAEVRQLQSKIMVSSESLPRMDRSYIASLPLENFFQVTSCTVGTFFVTCNTN